MFVESWRERNWIKWHAERGEGSSQQGGHLCHGRSRQPVRLRTEGTQINLENWSNKLIAISQSYFYQYLGCHNDSYLQCYRVLPSAEWRLYRCNHFNVSQRSRCCICIHLTLPQNIYHAITHWLTNIIIYLPRFLWTVNSLSTGVWFVLPRLTELV